MFIKQKITKTFATIVLLIFVLILSTSFGFYNNVFASDKINCVGIYQEIAMNYFKESYFQRNIKFSQLYVEREVDLNDVQNQVVAKVVIIKRDNTYDYLVLNIATGQIDEIVFDDKNALMSFDTKTYYTGPMQYYRKSGDDFVHRNFGVISKSIFLGLSKNISERLEVTKKVASKRYHSAGNPLPYSNKTGYNGFYGWSTMYDFNKGNDYQISNYSHITGTSIDKFQYSGLYFCDQDIFNKRFGTNNSCGPTALTNIYIWYNHQLNRNNNTGKPLLLNQSAFDTFDKFRVLTKHNNRDGTYTNTYKQAIIDYTGMLNNYEIAVNNDINKFDKFAGCIEKDNPILTSIQLKTNDGNFGHAVVTTGFEIFSQSYEVEEGWWLWKKKVTKYRYNRYLRVVDGWSSSNSVRYIDFEGYWDSITGWGVDITPKRGM